MPKWGTFFAYFSHAFFREKRQKQNVFLARKNAINPRYTRHFYSAARFFKIFLVWKFSNSWKGESLAIMWTERKNFCRLCRATYFVFLSCLYVQRRGVIGVRFCQFSSSNILQNPKRLWKSKALINYALFSEEIVKIEAVLSPQLAILNQKIGDLLQWVRV